MQQRSKVDDGILGLERCQQNVCLKDTSTRYPPLYIISIYSCNYSHQNRKGKFSKNAFWIDETLKLDFTNLNLKIQGYLLPLQR